MISYVESYDEEREKKRKKVRSWLIEKKQTNHHNIFLAGSVYVWNMYVFPSFSPIFFTFIRLLSQFVVFYTIINIILFKLRYLFLYLYCTAMFRFIALMFKYCSNFFAFFCYVIRDMHVIINKKKIMSVASSLIYTRKTTIIIYSLMHKQTQIKKDW